MRRRELIPTQLVCPHPMAVDERWFQSLINTSWMDDEDDDPTAEIEVRNGIAIVPIHGLITKRGRFWWMNAFSCDNASLVMRSLVRDRADVRGIVLDIHSGGGEIFGTGGLADTIHQLRGIKPIISCVNEFACSAAYWIGSSADEILITSSGWAGSIGVVRLHVDYTEMDAKAGIKTSVLIAGKYKAIEHRTLTPELEAHEQGLVDEGYRQFVEAVARNRNTTPQDVIDRMADARIFIGQQAVDAGLADRVGTLAEVVDELASPRSSFWSSNNAQRAHSAATGIRYARRIVRS